MEIPENIYYETPRQEFIKIQIIEGLVNKYNRDMNLMDELNLLAKPMKIVLKPMLEN
jgi:hypothetical protein